MYGVSTCGSWWDCVPLGETHRRASLPRGGEPVISFSLRETHHRCVSTVGRLGLLRLLGLLWVLRETPCMAALLAGVINYFGLA